MGLNRLIRKDGTDTDLGGKSEFVCAPGDRVRLLPPRRRRVGPGHACRKQRGMYLSGNSSDRNKVNTHKLFYQPSVF